jgi:hypothetical protein
MRSNSIPSIAPEASANLFKFSNDSSSVTIYFPFGYGFVSQSKYREKMNSMHNIINFKKIIRIFQLACTHVPSFLLFTFTFITRCVFNNSRKLFPWLGAMPLLPNLKRGFLINLHTDSILTLLEASVISSDVIWSRLRGRYDCTGQE